MPSILLKRLPDSDKVILRGTVPANLLWDCDTCESISSAGAGRSRFRARRGEQC